MHFHNDLNASKVKARQMTNWKDAK